MVKIQLFKIGDRLMKYCSTCGAQIEDKACFCPHCGCMTDFYVMKKQNENSLEQNILSFFLPLVGLILYIAYSRDNARKANNCGKWALIGFCCKYYSFGNY